MNSLLLIAALVAAEPAHDAHNHQLEKLGKVTFQTSCSPQAHAVFIRGMTLLHSFEYPQSEKSLQRSGRRRSDLLDRGLGSRDEPLPSALGAPIQGGDGEGARSISESAGQSPQDRTRTRLSRCNCNLLSRFRQARSQDPCARLQRGDGGAAQALSAGSRGRDLLRSVADCDRDAGQRPELLAGEGRGRNLECGPQGRTRPSGRRSLSDPQFRLSGTGHARGAGRSKLRDHRPGFPARTAYAFAHLHKARDVGRFDRVEPQVGVGFNRPHESGRLRRSVTRAAARDGLSCLRLPADRTGCEG